MESGAEMEAPLMALVPLITLYLAVEVSLRILALWAQWGWVTVFEGLQVYVTVITYGPGVDYTLFLAAPVASKGRLLQYAGRILRPYDGKATAEVHDYHDEHVGVLASSLAKRAPGYTSLGFPDPRKLPYSPSAGAVPPVVQASRG